LPRRAGTGRLAARCELRAVTANADIILFTYAIVLVGLATGIQMLYLGSVARRSMRLGGDAIAPDRLRTAGAIFTIAGILAFAVMAAEILSGAAGTDIRSFIAATVIVPVVTILFNAYRNRRT
jgi:hypothetical protein